MQYYSIILSALFLAVPAHPITSDNLKTILYSGVAINSASSFLSNISYTMKNMELVDVDITTNFKEAMWNTATIAACSVALYDQHKSRLVELLCDTDKSNNKSDEDKKLKAADFHPGSKRTK